jgi:ElaB/YqjD/DUF883 family membrane-anchored ribosome-binding protein
MEATRKNNHSGKGGSTDAALNFAPVVERVAAGAHEAVDKAAGAATKAARLIGRKGDVLLAAPEQYLESCRDRVRENPLAAMGVAVAAGIALSFLISRR